ncbi:hypothetical protein JCM10213_000459 [Rhodosporidiobolus nylandii]
MEVQLRHTSAPWSCRVSLRLEAKSDGSPREQVEKKAFGPVLSNPAEVEATLRRAQLGLLYPEVEDVSHFVKLNDKQVEAIRADPRSAVAGSKERLAFSKNVVCVEVRADSVTDLTLVDLPGLIDYSEHASEIKLVDELVESSITAKRSLILLTVSMRRDVETQKAFRFAKTADPDGKRTIGVLTQADLVQPGEHPAWIDILQGRKHIVANGFHATKLLSPEDIARNLSFEDARALEKAYFQEEGPWNGLDAATKRRLGTTNLTIFLSSKLGRFISEQLPQIQRDLAQTYGRILADLRKLPPPPSSDPVTELHVRLNTLQHQLNLLVQGDASGYHELIGAKNRNDEAFREAIRKTRPHFVPHLRSAEEGQAGEGAGETEEQQRPDRLAPLRMNLDEVHQHIKINTARELPRSTPYGAKTSLMLKALEHWPVLTQLALEDARPSVQRAVDKVIEQIFGKGTNEELRGIVRISAVETLETLFRQTSAKLDDVLELEKIPFTLNDHYFNAQVDAVLAMLKEEYHVHMKPEHQLHRTVRPEKVRDALTALTAAGWPGVVEGDLGRLRSADEYEDSLTAMANTVAYWKVASKRLIDNAPRIIDFSLLQKIPSALSQALLKKLVAGGEDSVIKRLMIESPEVAEERAELEVRKKKLEEAKSVLAAFGQAV